MNKFQFLQGRSTGPDEIIEDVRAGDLAVSDGHFLQVKGNEENPK
jgi:hypothetical protein